MKKILLIPFFLFSFFITNSFASITENFSYICKTENLKYLWGNGLIEAYQKNKQRWQNTLDAIQNFDNAKDSTKVMFAIADIKAFQEGCEIFWQRQGYNAKVSLRDISGTIHDFTTKEICTNYLKFYYGYIGNKLANLNKKQQIDLLRTLVLFNFRPHQAFINKNKKSNLKADLEDLEKDYIQTTYITNIPSLDKEGLFWLAGIATDYQNLMSFINYNYSNLPVVGVKSPKYLEYVSAIATQDFSRALDILRQYRPTAKAIFAKILSNCGEIN